MSVKRAEDLRDIIQGIKARGAVSLRDIAAELNRMEIATARGGSWSATQVNGVLKHA